MPAPATRLRRQRPVLVKPCARCRKLIPYGRSYCDPCGSAVIAEREESSRKRKKANDRAYNAKRDPKYLRFYASGDWKRLSRAKMDSAGYRCEGCGAIAAEVHHIKPIQTPEGWSLRLDWSNLEAVCINCHNKRHGRWGKRTRNKKA